MCSSVTEEGPPGGPQDDTCLRLSLAELSLLVAGHGSAWLEEMLTHIADFAARAIPGADGSGLTLYRNCRPATVAASAPFVREVDTAQYRMGQGPSITAVAERRTVCSGSLGTERSWPRFGQWAAQYGVHSVLSLPLEAEGEHPLGSINIYAREKDAFDDRAVALGELFAVPAAISVEHGRSLSEARMLAGNLGTALTTRAVIDQSLGILMSRTGCSPDEAFDKIRVLSQAQNQKSAVVATSIVEEAVRRARARNLADRGPKNKGGL